MRLLYFVQYFPPEKASGLPIVTDMLEGFANYGWDVEVYVPTPTRGVSAETRKKYAARRREVHCDGKLIIHRMHLYREGKGFAQRSIRYILFSLECLLKGLYKPADAVFTGGGPPTQGVIAGLLHHWTRKKVIFNPQDLFPDSMIISGMVSEESAFVGVGRKIERFSYQNADAIITITEEMAEVIRARTADPNKVYVVRNWIDTEKTVPIERAENKLFDELKLSREYFYVCYAGNIGKMQGLETMIEAADRLRGNHKIRFVIFGNGSEESHIQGLIKEKKLTNIDLFPLQPLERVSEVYSLGDVAVISCRAGTGKAGMPSKTWTIMAAGAPILASFDLGGEMEQVIREAECGLCVQAEDAEKMAEAIEDFFHDPEKVKRCGRNARKYAELEVSKEQSVKKYIEIIEKTVENR